MKVAVPAAEVKKEIDGQLQDFRSAGGEIRPVEDAKAVVEAEDYLSADVEVWLADEWEAKQDESDEKPAGSTSVKPLKELKDVEVHVPIDKVGDLDVEDLQ